MSLFGEYRDDRVEFFKARLDLANVKWVLNEKTGNSIRMTFMHKMVYSYLHYRWEKYLRSYRGKRDKEKVLEGCSQRFLAELFEIGREKVSDIIDDLSAAGLIHMTTYTKKEGYRFSMIAGPSLLLDKAVTKDGESIRLLEKVVEDQQKFAKNKNNF